MTEPFLIAHLVRGEPAFDIAIQLEGSGTPSDPGPWWVIPTGGHRARPFWKQRLGEIVQNDVYFATVQGEQWWPADWPDHYPSSPISHPSITSGDDLLKDLGL